MFQPFLRRPPVSTWRRPLHWLCFSPALRILLRGADHFSGAGALLTSAHDVTTHGVAPFGCHSFHLTLPSGAAAYLRFSAARPLPAVTLASPSGAKIIPPALLLSSAPFITKEKKRQTAKAPPTPALLLISGAAALLPESPPASQRLLYPNVTPGTVSPSCGKTTPRRSQNALQQRC